MKKLDSKHLILASSIFIIGFCSTATSAREIDRREDSQEVWVANAINSPNISTTSNPNIPLEELELLLKPLTKTELETESDRWLNLLTNKVREVSQIEIFVQRKNREIEETREALTTLKEAQQQIEEAGKPDTEVSLETAQSNMELALEEARNKLEEVAEVEAKTEQDPELKSAIDNTDEPETTDAPEANRDDTVAGELQLEVDKLDVANDDRQQTSALAQEQLEAIEEKLQEALEAKIKLKDEVLVNLTQLRLEQAALAERIRIVIDRLEKKGGEVETYRQYVDAVSEIKVDISDTHAFWVTTSSWFVSEGGGRRWALETSKSLAIVTGFLFLAWLASRLYELIHHKFLIPITLRTNSKIDDHLLPALQTGIKFSIWMLGILFGLSTAGFEVSVVLTGLGIGGLAFALASQDIVANLFGGITILLQGKIAVGERLEVDGIKAKVREIGLRTTTLVELDYDYEIIVPNRKFIQETVSYIDTRPHYAVYERLHLHHNTSSEQIELALDLIKEVAANNEYIKGARPSFEKLNEYSLDIKFVYWIKKWLPEDREIFPSDLWKVSAVKSQMNLEIMREFEKYGLKLALPILLKDVPKSYRYGIFDVSSSSIPEVAEPTISQ